MKKKILIVEDEADLQRVYQNKFTTDGYDVVSATSGNEGLDFATSQHPDLILLDIMLPTGKLNGFDVLERLKRDPMLAKTPIIVLTNLDSEKESALAIGATDYLVKVNTPIEELGQKVQALIGPGSPNE